VIEQQGQRILGRDPITIRFTVDTGALLRALRNASQSMRELERTFRWCRPGPPPLRINGHEYHRRQRARTRRKK
jgi:hypothetical protein